MGTKEEIQRVIGSKEFKEYGKEFLEYAIKAACGDLEAMANLIGLVVSGPAFYKNVSFVQKLNAFLQGVGFDDDDLKGLAEAMANGSQNDNAERVLDCIDSIETSSKVTYITNATRSHIKFNRGFGGLNKSEYYRMLYIIKNILIDDIEFICANLKNKEMVDSISCVALANLGLMYVSTTGDGVKYAFSPLAYKFYEEVVVYDDESYPGVQMPDELPEKFQTGPNFIEF